MEEPAALLPFPLFGIQAHDQLHLAVEVMDGDPLERTGLRVEQPEIVNALLPAVPDLILLETSQGPLFLHLDQADVLGPVVGMGGDPFTQEKDQQGGQGGDGQDGEGNPVKADAVRLHGRDFAVPGQSSAGHKRGEEDGCGQNLRDDHRQPEEKIGSHLPECCMIAEKHPEFFEEINDQKKGD